MPEPFQGFGLYKLDDRARLYLPSGLSAFVAWFDPTATLECLAVPGRGGMAVFPPAALEEHREMIERLTVRNPRPADLGSAAYELARLAALTWPVTIAKARLQLPLGARELGLVPSEENALIAVVALRGIFELWHPAELRAQTQESSGRWSELKARALLGREPE